MAETTFAGQSRRYMLRGLDGNRERGEFRAIGRDLIESEELIDLIYRVFLPLITKDGWVSDGRISIDDIGWAYRGGFYLPCCERIVFSGQVDLKNDVLPGICAVVFMENGENPSFVSVRKVDRVPRGLYAPPDSQLYTMMIMYEDEQIKKDKALPCSSFFIAIRGDGTVFPMVDPHKPQEGYFAAHRAVGCRMGAMCINAELDSHHLWQVRTEESLTSSGRLTPLKLGVNEGHVKSLFYARSLPVTETGRKRPILHWVKAHQRRLKAGIDIDIKRFLRGIEKFEMEGFAFEIINPKKRAQ